MFRWDLSCVSICACHSFPVLSLNTRCKSLESSLDLHHVFTNTDQNFLSLLLPNLHTTSSLSLSSYGRYSFSPITFMTLYWTLSSMSRSLLYQKDQNRAPGVASLDLSRREGCLPSTAFALSTPCWLTTKLPNHRARQGVSGCEFVGFSPPASAQENSRQQLEVQIRPEHHRN